MKSWQFNISLCLAASLVGIISTLVTQAAWAEAKLENQDKLSQKGIDSLIQQLEASAFGDRLTNRVKQSKKVGQVSKLENPLTNAQQLLVQSPTLQTTPAPTTAVPITGVKANATSEGVEVILQTPIGTQLQVTNRSIGNNFIADVSGGQLRLPSGEAFTFRSQKPLAGITEITVTNIDATTVRVTVVGEKTLPTVELFDDHAGLVFAVVTKATAQQPPQTEEQPAPLTPQQSPAAQQDEPIELVVTGEPDSYRVEQATTATRTDTPLRDIPQSIQVVPQQVLEDRNVRNLIQALETVSGVVIGDFYQGVTSSPTYIIRGFSQQGNFRNGFRDNNGYSLTGIETVEQVEVLKGPASVLFGAVEPGGIVNFITKQPLSEPYYKIGFEAGSFGYYQPSIDLSGPLNTEKNLLYRLIVGYQSSDSYQDFTNSYLLTIAPSITWKLGDRTDLNLYYEYNKYFANPSQLYTGSLSDGSFLPRNLYLGYPGPSFINTTTEKFGYTFKHQFSDNWQIRNNFSVLASRTIDKGNSAAALVDDRFLEMVGADSDFTIDNYFGQADLLGKFNTGSISHQLLLGFDVNRNAQTYKQYSVSGFPNLDILNPNYNVTKPEPVFSFDNNSYSQSYGIYLQDQIALQDNLKLLVGGRYDWTDDSKSINNVTQETTKSPGDSAFSPRIGLVYQPSKEVSLYTSYSRSFVPNGTNLDGELFEPTRGTQYEVGIKTDLLENRLSATLAAYKITKSNVLVPDPDDERARDGYQIQIGEQRSQGIELDITGEILPGWKVTASYAYTNAEVTEDTNPLNLGDRLQGVPENQASLWTTYEIQNGNLKGLGFGLGLFYVGTRLGDLPNTYTVEDYLRTDAAIYYRKDGFNAAINIRNLFDTEYVLTPGFGSPSSGGTFFQRGEPLTIVGSISWEF